LEIHVIFTLTVNFKLFLRKRLAAQDTIQKLDRGANCAAVSVLLELSDRTSVTEAQVHKIGMIAIPTGAGANAGKAFAAC
jgi:hypothetical protein